MAYDEGLAERLDELFASRPNFESKKMFGGLCFMLSGHMCCGIVGDTLMARVGPDQYADCLQRPHSREMDFTGRAMKGMVYVAPEGIADDSDLTEWVRICVDYVQTMPPK